MVTLTSLPALSLQHTEVELYSGRRNVMVIFKEKDMIIYTVMDLWLHVKEISKKSAEKNTRRIKDKYINIK